MEISKRDCRALMILCGIGLAVAAYIVVVEPVMDWYDGLVSQHQVLTSKVYTIVTNNQKADYLTELVEQWEKKVGELSPPKNYSEQITAVSADIVAASQTSKIKLNNSSWTAPKAWPHDPRLEMTMLHLDGEGTWENIFKFLAEVYRVPGVLSVEQMNLSSRDKSGKKIALRLAVSVWVQAESKAEAR